MLARPVVRIGGLIVGLAVLLWALSMSAGWAATPDAEIAAKVNPANPMAVLSPEDAARYRQIFELQETGEWRAADKLIKDLNDRILMGHVLFQRYMHPTKYRSKYSELAPWLKQYRDHPGASRIYRLARKRKPAKARAPVKPPPTSLRAATGQPPKVTVRKPRPPASKRREIAALKSRVSRYLRRGAIDRAEKQLWASIHTGVLDDAAFDVQLARVAESYFYEGDDDKALALGALASRSGDAAPMANWIAGLAAWRLGEADIAATHFEALAGSATGSPWLIGAAAYWGARAYLVSGQPAKVNPLLKVAARHQRTFYGLIAARQLGLEMNYSWDLPPLEATDYLRLAKVDGVRRAIALIEAGKSHLADQDLRLVARRGDKALRTALLGLSARLNLPATQLVVSYLLRDGSANSWDSVEYPMPDWEPEGGFSLDKAVMFAVIRQESRFNARAISSAGARGLMQLMPSTASFIARDRSLRNANRTKLYSPDFNMALGQQYLEYLSGLDYIDGNMFLVVGAYNGGPGNISRWLKKVDHGEDWLLFIETIPKAETRDFIERVLSNLWIYRMRMGQPANTLDAVARGDWPIYTAIDNTQFKAASADNNQVDPWPDLTKPSPSSLSPSPY